MRLFVAIEVNSALRALAREVAAELESLGVGGRFESLEKLHVTLAFLGNVGDEQLEAVQGTFQESRHERPFSIDFDRVGAYPNAFRPHTIWLGSSRHNNEFAHCAKQLRAGFVRLGFRFDHDADPHVTICRPKGVRGLQVPALSSSARVHVEGLTLYQSLPAGQTTRYEAVDRTKFLG